MILEMNNTRKDADLFGSKFEKTSPVSEVFSAMVSGKPLDKYSKGVNDKAVSYIKNLAEQANNGNPIAMAEINTLRRFTIENPVLQEMKLLAIFGSYQNVGFDDTIEREVYTHVGDRSRIQANNGDVTFPAIVKNVYAVPTFTVSGGYEVDYRRVALGDMSKENEGLAQVKIDILNRAKSEIMKKVYKAIKTASGVNYVFDGAGLTKAGVDGVLNNIRRFGKPTITGDYALISQLTPFAGYVGNINEKTILGISDDIINEIAKTGAIHTYQGAIVAEMENPFDVSRLNASGDNFETMLPQGLGLVLPTGSRSPIATYTRGGLTSMTGTDIKTGRYLSRFDIEVGCDVAKGLEYQIGILHDSNLDSLND